MDTKITKQTNVFILKSHINQKSQEASYLVTKLTARDGKVTQ